jgi:hypothetical protein
MLRAFLFSVFPLVAATTLLRRRGVSLDRRALRAPFFSQCYLTAPFALALSAALVLARLPAVGANAGGAVIGLLGLAWYLAVETGWFSRQLGVGSGPASIVAMGTFLRASLYCTVGTVALALLI